MKAAAWWKLTRDGLGCCGDRMRKYRKDKTLKQAWKRANRCDREVLLRYIAMDLLPDTARGRARIGNYACWLYRLSSLENRCPTMKRLRKAVKRRIKKGLLCPEDENLVEGLL